MRARWTVLAWSLFALFVALAVCAFALVAVGWTSKDQALVLLCSGYAVVGALVASREPRNAVGWLMLLIAVSFASTNLADAYLTRADVPAQTWVAWFSAWGWNVWLYVSSGVLPFLFPDGHVLSPRWRYALGLGIFTVAASILSSMLKPGPLDAESPGKIDNPLGVGGAAAHALSVVSQLGNFIAVVVIVLGGASLVARLRRSHGRAREQVKWFVYFGAMAVAALCLALVDVIIDSLNGPQPSPPWSQVLGAIGWFGALFALVVGIPTAIGIAILRHRLYGIDVVINRTLVYGSLTLLLLGTYLALVLSLRIVLSPLTGESDLAVAASTLAVAGLFRPARARIQHVVDRRFFRSRYDAERTLEGFAAQLRSELDIDSLGSDLRDVVSSTMHPEHVSLWLRSTP
jgi:hypothetical protein